MHEDDVRSERKEGREELRTLTLHVTVDIFVSRSRVYLLVMRYIVDLVFLDKFWSDHPRRFGNHFVYPATVSGCF